MSVNQEFISDISNYILVNNKINEINTQLKKQKEKRSSHEKKIIEFVQKNNMSSNRFNLNNNIISFTKQRQSPTISLKLLKEVLEETLKNQKYVDIILDNISKKRVYLSKINYSIKLKKK